MHRLAMLLMTLLLLAGVIVMPASAESAASHVESYITVTSDGDCMVSTTARVRLETPVDSLTFPLPANAADVTLNGGTARTSKTDSAVEVDVSRVVGGMTGEITMTFNYNIPGAVKAIQPDDPMVEEDPEVRKNYLKMEIPLLNSFSLPVESLGFVLTMPDNIPYHPTFNSIYQQTGIDASLSYDIDKNMLTGKSTQPLNDHEAITMTMVVPVSMFPSVSTYIREGNPELVPMLVCGGLALLYWLLFLRTLPLIRRRSVTPPEGVTAGEMGCHLTLAGGDLTMMVFHWAQLGYILIQRDGGRVMLHKRMDMGNERSPFEMKVYRMLFANRRSVEATGQQYALLSRKVFSMIPGERNLCRPNSGNTRILRALGCGTHAFCGVCIAMNLTQLGVLQVMLSIILVVVGVVSAWQIHEIAYRTHLRGKTRVYIGLACFLIWVLLGLLCGQWLIPLCSALWQFVLGYLAAYGGRRSDIGRHDAGQILGLRSYLKHIPKSDIQRMLKTDPEYYFNMAPFALSLGVIRPFSASFGSIKMDQCPYLVSRIHGKRTAAEWGDMIADTADLIDSRFRQMEIQKWTNPTHR